MRRIYTSDDLDDYLEHHGILGQKWGRLNGPPYPLGIEDHSSAQKKQLPKPELQLVKVLAKEALKILKT